MCRTKKILMKLFWLIFAVSMFCIFGIALSKPLHNLVPQRMVLFTLFWIVLFGVLWYGFLWLEKRCGSLERRMKYILPLFLLCYGIALFGVSCLLRSTPVTDYQNVYEAALQLARGENVANWDYFARWYNNVGCMLVLALLFFLGSWLPAAVDVYYFVLFLNVVQVVCVIACLYYLAGRLVPRHRLAAGLMTLAVCALWIPIWGNSSIFYSDQLSFGAGVFGLTLLVKGWKKQNWYVYLAAAGAVLAVGVILKVTVATILIALGIAGFLFSKLWKHKKKIVVLGAAFVVVFSGYSLYCKTLPYQQEAYQYKIPTEYWLAVGLGENGTYAGSLELAARCEAAENYDARKAVARAYIAENIDKIWNIDHIVGKVRQNFGCGDLGSAGYLLYKDDPNFLWNWFSQEGTYFWKYSCISTSLFFAVLFLLGIGGVLQFMKKGEPGEADMLLLAVELAFWGLCLFLMLWEAQNKQLYNHSGWMLLGLVCSLNLIGEAVGKGKRRK